MVKFHVGINRYSFQENSEEKIEKLVKDLNSLFGDYECKFHSHPEWSIGVDLLKTGSLQFSSMKHNGCSFPLTLLDESLTPYLDTLKIFPLPTE
jgi:hypothetical protein